MIQSLLAYNDWADLLLRLALGAIFLAHGWPKIKNLKQNAQNFAMMGFSPSYFWGTIVAFVEFFGGLALIGGLFTSVAASLLAIDMFVAVLWKIKRGQKLVGGFELDLTLFSALLVLATMGGGVYSLDAMWNVLF